ncbi:MAG: AAA family ATPase, partial [Candidatus Methanomethylophilaceae archaeon]
MRSIPIGIDDFKELRDEGGYYVDKTSFISDILNSNLTKVFLYTRPRRFGKSLNLSMLDAYL